MRPGGGKAKGKSFEDKIAKLLHEEFYNKHSEYKILFDQVGNNDLRPQRDSSSGTFQRADGDIELNLLKKYFPFSVECKDWKTLNLNLNQILYKESTELKKIYNDQAKENADRKELIPIIVFKANRTQSFVYFNRDLLTELPKNYIILEEKIIMLLNDFLKIWIKEN